MVPSDDSLFLHWQQSCWVIGMWKRADMNTMVLKPMTEFGWQIREQKLTIAWDSEENLKAIRERVSLLLHGCKCTTGCRTGQCTCRRKRKDCTEGCQCLNCTNIASHIHENTNIDKLVVEETYLEGNDDKDIDEIIDGIFGPGEE